jgi:hypothetical protein
MELQILRDIMTQLAGANDEAVAAQADNPASAASANFRFLGIKNNAEI